MLKKLEWIALETPGEFIAKVPGGWILKVMEEVYHDRSAFGRGMEGGWDWRVALCFIPETTEPRDYSQLFPHRIGLP